MGKYADVIAMNVLPEIKQVVGGQLAASAFADIRGGAACKCAFAFQPRDALALRFGLGVGQTQHDGVGQKLCAQHIVQRLFVVVVVCFVTFSARPQL